MGDIEVAVAVHKNTDNSEMFDSCYRLLYVGATVHEEGKINSEIWRDDVGESISEKNPTYCELTGLYWMWKNSSAKVKGLCHYRRFLAKHYYGMKPQNEVFTAEELTKIFSEYDVMLPRPKYKYHKSKVNHWYPTVEELEQDVSYSRLKKAVKSVHSDCMRNLEDVYRDDKLSFCNVMIARADVFDSYCEWLFPIGTALEKQYSDIGGVPPREFAFVSEWLLNVWMQHNFEKYRVFETPLMRIDKSCGMMRLPQMAVERFGLLDWADKISHTYFM